MPDLATLIRLTKLCSMVDLSWQWVVCASCFEAWRQGNRELPLRQRPGHCDWTWLAEPLLWPHAQPMTPEPTAMLATEPSQHPSLCSTVHQSCAFFHESWQLLVSSIFGRHLRPCFSSVHELFSSFCGRLRTIRRLKSQDPKMLKIHTHWDHVSERARFSTQDYPWIYHGLYTCFLLG